MSGVQTHAPHPHAVSQWERRKDELHTIYLVAEIWHQTWQEASCVPLHEVAEELDEMFMLESCDDLSLPRREESHQVKLLMLHGGW